MRIAQDLSISRIRKAGKSGMVQLPDLRGRQERGGWGRAGDIQRAPSAPASDLGASPFGRRPQASLSCDLRLNEPCPRPEKCQQLFPYSTTAAVESSNRLRTAGLAVTREISVSTPVDRGATDPQGDAEVHGSR